MLWLHRWAKESTTSAQRTILLHAAAVEQGVPIRNAPCRHKLFPLHGAITDGHALLG